MRASTPSGRPRSTRRVVVTLVSLSVVASACGSDGDDALETASTPASTAASSTEAPATSAPATTEPDDATDDTRDTTSTRPRPTTTTSTTTPTQRSTTTTVRSSGATTTVVPVTTVAPATTAAATTTTTAPTTTAAPTTTIGPLTPEAVQLRPDGLGPLAFGTPTADLVARLTAALGEPIFDAVSEYPVPWEGGQFAYDEFGDEIFSHPWGGTYCFDNDLCLQVGGPAQGAMTFVGWSYFGVNPPVLVTPSGVTAGASWADFPAMIVNEGGCYTEGTGEIDGVRLQLTSEGVLFGDFDENGNYIPGRPDPADTFVIGMEAGSVPVFPFVDC